MVQIDMRAERLEGSGLTPALSGLLTRQHPDAIVRLKIRGRAAGRLLAGLRAEAVRALVPPTMNLSVRWAEDPTYRLET